MIQTTNQHMCDNKIIPEMNKEEEQHQRNNKMILEVLALVQLGPETVPGLRKEP